MKALVEKMVKALVERPEDVQIKEQIDGEQILVEVRVHESDIGKVIGKGGRTAKAIRSVVYAAAMKEQKRVRVDIVD
ncbi:KH domain-containing protein [Alkalihalobacillus sp. 1P02AB]|uniref:KH domain-containing protein n=1 Tax=Alkalihalobacillus sp. 1P02AB TaxID=3132260 RepID=UPI0039A5E85D